MALTSPQPPPPPPHGTLSPASFASRLCDHLLRKGLSSPGIKALPLLCFGLFFFNFIHLFIYVRCYCGVWDFQRGAWTLRLRHVGSVVAVHRLGCPETHRTLAPRPGMEPVSPALLGGFLTTGPPAKSPPWVVKPSPPTCCMFVCCLAPP